MDVAAEELEVGLTAVRLHCTIVLYYALYCGNTESRAGWQAMLAQVRSSAGFDQRRRPCVSPSQGTTA